MPPPTTDTFTLGPFRWDIAAALALTRDHPIARFRPGACRSVLNFVGIDTAHARTVDLTIPVIIAQVPELASVLPIDGWHRIHRALTDGVELLPCRILTPAEEYTVRLYGGSKGDHPDWQRPLRRRRIY